MAGLLRTCTLTSALLLTLLPPRAFASAPDEKPLDLVFRNGRGEDLALRDLRGQPLLLYVFASSIRNAPASIATVADVAREVGPEISVLALSIDRDAAALERFLEATKPPLRILADPSGALVERLVLSHVPALLVVDPFGRVRNRHEPFASSDASAVVREVGLLKTGKPLPGSATPSTCSPP